MPAGLILPSRLMPWLLMAFALFFVSAVPAMPRTPGAGGGSITGLFNTGLDSGGNPLADGATDAHYALTSTPGGAGGTSYVTLQKFPITNGAWMADTATSKWIFPYADESLYLDPPGNYTYQTTFTVSGDATTVQINGNAAADNLVTAIILNGQTVATNVSGGFQAFSSFTISSGFVSGTNTLQFIVNNQSTDNNPSGFRCEMTAGTVTPPTMGITGLFNTGLDASGNPGLGGSADPHYALVSTPGGSGGTAYVTLQKSLVGGGAWMDNTNASKWISPTADESQQPDPPGDYTYQTTFTVTGDPATAIVMGQLAADNSVSAIVLNGQTVATNVSSTFTSFTAFTIRSGFVAGANTLRFVVHNLPYDNPNSTQNNPSGFRCEMTGSAGPVSTQTSLTVYRLDNATTLDHICTVSATERDRLVAQGYASKGVLGKTPPDSAGAAPVYRLVSSTTGRHLFTNSQSERSSLLANGWNDEGTAFTVYTASAPRRKPLFRLYRNIAPGETLYTNSQTEHDTLIASNQWADQGIVGYLATPQTPHPDHPLPAWAEGSLESDGAGVTGSGPSSADQVNLASGVYENQPDADIGGLNTVGPSPVFARMYRTANALNGYASPGLPVGWTHNYDVQAQSDPNNGGLVQLAYSNGAKELWTPPGSISTGQIVSLAPPQGAPYIVTGLAVANMPINTQAIAPNGVYWQWLSITFKDHSRWMFTPASAQSNHYLLTSIVNTVGRAITLQYDAAGRLASIINDAAPQSATLLAFTYDGGLLSRVTEYADPLTPRYVSYTTGASGADAGNAPVLQNVSQIGTVRDPHPARWTYDYQGYGGSPFLSMVSTPSPTGAGSAAHAIAYDENGCVSRLTDADQNTRDYSYEAAGTGVQVQGQTGQGENWTQATNDANLDTGGTDALNKNDSVTYGDMANPYSPTSALNKNGQLVQMDYDDVGNVTLTTVPVVNGNHLTTTYGYDYNGFTLGRLTSIQTGGRTPTTIEYDPNTNLVTRLGTPRPGTSGTGEHVYTTYTYTALGNVATVTTPAPADNGTVQYTYNYTSDTLGNVNQAEALGRPLTITDPMGHITHLRYDARGNLTTVMTLAGGQLRQTVIQYNVADQPIQVTYPATGQTGTMPSYVATTYQYPGGPATMTTLYDEAGNVARQTAVGRGGEGQVKQQTGSAEKVNLAFDGLSRLSQLKDGNGSAFTHVYDAVGNLTRFTAPGGITHTATFDADGNVTGDTDGRNRSAVYTLSPDDSSVTGVTYSDATPAAQYQYDGYGRVTAVSDSTVTLTYAYDDLDDVTTATTRYAALPVTFTLDYAYYADGQRKSLHCPTLGGTNAYDYAYDADGKPASVSFPWGNVCTYEYDEGDRLIRCANAMSVTRYLYNALDQLTAQESRVPNGDPNADTSLQAGFYNLTHDATGNLTRIDDRYPMYTLADLSASRTFTYDAQDRLTGEGILTGGQFSSTTHAYDAADNFTLLRGSQVGNNAGAQQLTYDGGGTGYGYDGEGNTARSNLAANTITYAYDALNHLTQMSTNGYAYVFTPRYRPDGLLGYFNRDFSSFTDNNSVAPPQVAQYNVYDGTRKLFDYVYGSQNGPAFGGMQVAYGWGATGVEASYVHGIFSAISQGRPAYLYIANQSNGDIADPLGNITVRALHDPTFLHWTFYDAFGLQTYDTGSYYGFYDNLGYKGQSGAETFALGGYDDTTGNNYPGLILMGYRWYNPTIGRFYTRDPQGYDGGVNLYAFCRNNPINHSDPLGLQDDGGPEGITLGSTTSLGTSLHRNVNKEMNRQIVKPIAGVVHTLAELHPGTPLAKAFTGKDNYANRLSTASRVGNGFMAAVIFMPSSGMGTVLEGQLARFLGRKGATVITDEAALTFYVRGSGKTVFDGQIGKLLYEVKSKLNTDTISVAKNIKQWNRQMTAARNAGMNYRVFIKAEAVPSEYQAFFTTSGIKYTLIQ